MSDSNYPSILPTQPPPPVSPPPAPMPPVAPPPPAKGKTWPPFMGMLSIVTVVFPILFLCLYCMFVYWMGSQYGYEAEAITDADLAKFGIGTLALVCGSVLASLVGIAIGLGALFGRTANKVLGIIGLVMNGLMLLAIVCGIGYLFLF